MAEVFVDTSGWASFPVRTEPRHTEAAATMKRWRADKVQVVTTNYILAELVALLTSPLRVHRPRQVSALDTIRMASWVSVVHVDAELDARAWELLRSRPDKEWSLVDCASFVVMEQRGISEALATDPYFEQAGSVALSRN